MDRLTTLLKIARARLRGEEARLAKLGAEITLADQEIEAARNAASNAGAIDAHAAVDRYYKASVARLQEADSARRMLETERLSQIARVKTELRRVLSLESAAKDHGR